MTRMQFEKVFRKRSLLKNETELKFMTIEQFEREVSDAVRRAEKMLQMPPIVKVKEDQTVVLDHGTRIAGFSTSKFLITDISFDTKDSDRMVLIRQPDGTLEYAPQDIRKRCIQVYFPLEGRQIAVPKMFEAEFLQGVLDRHEYEFLLDRLNIQFDPYERRYHEIASQTYQHINNAKRFDDLRSTRHFGPMAFFLAWHKMIDDLLGDNIKRDFLRSAVELILLQYKLHACPEEQALAAKLHEFPDKTNVVKEYCSTQIGNGSDDVHQSIEKLVGKSAEDFAADNAFLTVIEDFIRKYATKKVQLDLAVQTFREEAAQKKQLNEKLQKQHGLAN